LMFGLLATAWVALRTGEPVVRGLPVVPTPQRASAAGTIHVDSTESVAT
ncbi:MAG: hypothetical protein JNK45_16340, partial [Myxococcales bacterium]|nr:hypothetical protein [Myxococcales bacterium]